jgi:hypothetical protein
VCMTEWALKRTNMNSFVTEYMRTGT